MYTPDSPGTSFTINKFNYTKTNFHIFYNPNITPLTNDNNHANIKFNTCKISHLSQQLRVVVPFHLWLVKNETSTLSCLPSIDEIRNVVFSWNLQVLRDLMVSLVFFY